MSDIRYVFYAFLAALAATVLVALFGKGLVDAEITKALTYAVVGLVGALGGVSRRTSE